MPALFPRSRIFAPRPLLALVHRSLGAGGIALAGLILSVFALPALADDQPARMASLAPAAPWGDAVPLVRDDAWAGWDYGADGTRGWTLKGPALSASNGAADLLSGWSFADFELSFTAIFGPDARLELQLPRVPSGDGLTIHLHEGAADCGRITSPDAPESLFAGAALGMSSVGSHRFTITRTGATLTVSANDKVLGSASINPVRRFGLALKVAQGDVSLDRLTAREPLGEPLVTRDDLADWWTPSAKNKQSWQVENGELVCLNQDGNYIRTAREFGNFVISFDYLIKRGGNSGIGIRTPRHGWPSGEGMELQITDEKPNAPITRHSPMAIYGNLEPLGRTAKPDEWNRVVIKADGWIVSAWMNGVLVQHANTKRLPDCLTDSLKVGLAFRITATQYATKTSRSSPRKTEPDWMRGTRLRLTFPHRRCWSV